jgi:hypothetical protein
MSNRVIKKQWYNFYHGLDHHNGLYWVNVWTRLAPVGAPPVPIPPGMSPSPYSIHGVQYMATDWFSMDDKSHANILADGSPVFSRNHTIKRTIHCPPGINFAVVSTIAFSTSTFKLGVASVQGNGEPLASTLWGPAFVTVQCGDPASLPTGAGLAPGTVHVSWTGADMEQAFYEWALAGLVEIGASWLFGKLMDNAWADALLKQLGRPIRFLARENTLPQHIPVELFKRLGRNVEVRTAAEVAKLRKEAAREATEKTIRENGYDAFLSNEARRLGVNPKNMDDATKKSIDEAFEKEVEAAGKQAAANTGQPRVDPITGKVIESSPGSSAKETTEGWFEGQRKSGEGYSAPPSTQPSPTQAHGAKAESAANQKIIEEEQKGFGKGVEAFGGDQFKKSSGDQTSEEIDKAAKEWSGVEETKP